MLAPCGCPLAWVKLSGAKRRSFLREKARASFARTRTVAPKSPALPFTPITGRLPAASVGPFWLFPVKQLRYNATMNHFRRPRGLLLVLVAVLVVVTAVLVMRDNRREAVPATSPLSTPVDAVETLGTPPRSSSAVALLWVVLGSLLALGVAALILRRSRRDEQ